MLNIIERIESISNKNEFIQFVNDLAMNNRENPDEWANTTISDYLEQMAAWVEDFSECPMNDIDWKQVDFSVLARILYMGKLYE